MSFAFGEVSREAPRDFLSAKLQFKNFLVRFSCETFPERLPDRQPVGQITTLWIKCVGWKVALRGRGGQGALVRGRGVEGCLRKKGNLDKV